MAIIPILLAVTLPVSHKVRVLAYRARYASQLKQIATAWQAYLVDNNQIVRGVSGVKWLCSRLISRATRCKTMRRQRK